MVILMNGTVIAVSGFVGRCKPSRIERRGSWPAARGSELPPLRLPRKHSDQRSQRGALPAGSRLRSTPIALPSFSAPRYCHGAMQSASHKARITGQRFRSPLGPMRHNPAVVRDAPRASFVRGKRNCQSSRHLGARHSARPTPPRWASHGQAVVT